VTIVPGLCSVTLRAHGVGTVAELAAACGLTAVEWGADVHVPPGDATAIERATAACGSSGVRAASYGSYLLAAGPPSADEVVRVLDTAVALGASNVRVWTPFGATVEDHPAVVRALAAVAGRGAERGLTIGTEFHGGTPTATAAAAVALLGAVDAANLFSYWQPPYWVPGAAPTDDVAAVTTIGRRLSHLHVYEWTDAEHRRPLGDGTARWTAVLDAVAASPAPVDPRVAFLEFVAGDDPDALRRDAATLRAWLDREGVG
jgi:sugar phosphate isomerase/epimerase